MRDITVIALVGRAWLQAELRVLLVPAQQIIQHVLAVGEDVSGIFENSEAKVVLHVGQRRRRKTQFKVIQEQRTPAQRKPGDGIARTCLI